MGPAQPASDVFTRINKRLDDSYQPSFGNFFLNVVPAALGGAIMGAIIGAPVLLTAGVWAAAAAIINASHFTVTALAENYNWEKSNVVLAHAIVDAVLFTALTVTAVSLGIFGTTGAIVFGVVTGCVALYNFSRVVSLKLEEQPQPLRV
ncbi:MAG: hypothetical protein H0T62_08410 [Parachlamydiaceae bacterium]|nr:hypothetical protein [Parachlamydiaceae bacterium]